MPLYYYFNFAASVVLFAFNMLNFKEKKRLLSGAAHAAIKHFKQKKRKGIGKILSKVGFWVTIEILVVSLAQYAPILILNDLFGKIMNTGTNYFGLLFFGVLLVIAVCVLIKVDPLAQLDLITPAYPLALTFSKIGCFFGGCCSGIVWEKGFYNPHSGLVEFPSPLLEAAVALLLFVFLLAFRRKFKKGTMFPVYVTVYSALRFFTEMLRSEPKVFMGLRTYQLICIAGIAIGVIEYIAVCKYAGRNQKRKDLVRAGNEKRG